MSNLAYLIAAAISVAAAAGAAFGYMVLKAIELHYEIRVSHSPDK